MTFEVVLAEILVHHPDDILLGDGIIGIGPGQLVLPGKASGECLDHYASPVSDPLEAAHLVLLQVLFDLIEDVLGEFALLHLPYLIHAHLHGLFLASERNIRNISEQHQAGIVEGLVESPGEQHLVGVPERIQQAAAAFVRKQLKADGKRNEVRIGLFRSAEGPASKLDDRNRNLDVHGLLALERLYFKSTGRSHSLVFKLSESLFKERLGLGCSQVAAEDYRHIPWNIVSVIEFRHLGKLRVLEVLGGSDDRAGVRSLPEVFLQDSLQRRLDRIVRIHVLLLVDSLKLALEKPEHGLAQALRIKLAPLGKELGSESIVVHRIVIGCTGIEAAAAETGNEPVKFVRNGIGGRFVAEPVDVLLDLHPLIFVRCPGK